MKVIYKLHTYGNHTYYAFIVSLKEQPDRFLLRLKSLLDEATEEVKGHYGELVNFKPKGLFKNLDDRDFNGCVGETCETDPSILSPDDPDYEEIRPWKKYDYVNKKYIDWFTLLMTKGPEDPEFIKNYGFSYKDSFETSLINSGIKKEEVNNVYVFSVFDCRSDKETKPFEFPIFLKNKIESDRSVVTA